MSPGRLPLRARKRLPTLLLVAVAVCASGAPAGCSHSSAPAPYLSEGALLDPQTCAECHVDHYQDWSGSMHAYASDDPVFVAMNARGQRETNGALGAFCVTCHAPMAVQEGATTDGLNLSTVPQKLKGVTCFFCHQIDATVGSHNGAVSLAGDLVMRGEYSDPVENAAHASTYDVLHDRDRIESASLCGACHDVVTPAGGAIERTFAEWQSSAYAQAAGSTCGQCHMPESTTTMPIAQVPNAPARLTHGHAFAAVDVALTPGFPNAASQNAAITQFLGTTLQSALCVTETGAVRVLLDNVAAGHFFPSGASQDRRAWAEVIASKAGSVIYQSGVVPDGTPVTSVTNDPDLWLLRDCMFNAASPPAQVDMFWQAATYESNALPVQATFDPTDPRYYQTHIVQSFPRALDATLPAMPDQVTLRIRLQPIGLDVLNDLVASGDLESSVLAATTTFYVTPLLTWTPAAATLTYDDGGILVSCVSATSFNVGATKNPAVNHMRCSP